MGSARGCPYLLLLGVELEALVQGAAVLLPVRLLLPPHALRVLHRLLLDAPEQPGGHSSPAGVTRVPGCPPSPGPGHSPLFGAHVPLHRQLHVGRAPAPLSCRALRGGQGEMSPEALSPWGHLRASPWWQAGTATTSHGGNVGPGTQCWGSRVTPLWLPKASPLRPHGDTGQPQEHLWPPMVTTRSHTGTLPAHGDATGHPRG